MQKEEITKDQILQIVSFSIEKEEFGIDIAMVQEINRMVNITKIPNAPGFVEGIINLRGRVIPVLDLRTRLGLTKKEFDRDTRIIVIEITGKVTGFIVDKVNEVLRIPESLTEIPPEIISGINTDFITSVAKLEDRLLILLDMQKVLNDDEKELLKGTMTP